MGRVKTIYLNSYKKQYNRSKEFQGISDVIDDAVCENGYRSNDSLQSMDFQIDIVKKVLYFFAEKLNPMDQDKLALELGYEKEKLPLIPILKNKKPKIKKHIEGY